MRGVLLLGAVLSASIASEASACSRCGIFGNRCRFASHAVAAVAVAPVVVKSPEVFVVNNVYAQPNGAALLAQQGGTVYGLQGAAQPYLLNPDAILRQAAELARGAQSLTQTGLNGYTTTANLALQLNAQATTPLAQGLAASAVLNAAGLNPATQQLNAPQSLRIYRGADGQWKIEQGEAASITARLETSGGGAAGQPAANVAEAPAPPDAVATTGSLVASKCAKCHGLQLTQPKKGLFFDSGHTLDCKSSLAAVRAVMAGKMPPGQSLSPEERSLLVDELVKLAANE